MPNLASSFQGAIAAVFYNGRSLDFFSCQWYWIFWYFEFYWHPAEPFNVCKMHTLESLREKQADTVRQRPGLGSQGVYPNRQVGRGGGRGGHHLGILASSQPLVIYSLPACLNYPLRQEQDLDTLHHAFGLHSASGEWHKILFISFHWYCTVRESYSRTPHCQQSLG